MVKVANGAVGVEPPAPMAKERYLCSTLRAANEGHETLCSARVATRYCGARLTEAATNLQPYLDHLNTTLSN